MFQEVINTLPPILANHISTLEKISCDTTNGKVMIKSDLKLINFDKIPNEYARGRHWTGIPKSNDGLYIQGVEDEDKEYYFIEFKNGQVKEADIYRKMYDSLMMLIDLRIIADYSYVREHVKYILVYNPEKMGKPVTSESESRTAIYKWNQEKANKKEVLFRLDKWKGYLLKDVMTYDPDTFIEEFVKKIE